MLQPLDKLATIGFIPSSQSSKPSPLLIRVTPDRDLAMRIISSVDMGAYEKQYVTCPGDATGDGLIDTDDLLAVINNWGNPGGPAGDIAPAPCGNSIVDTDDLLAVINNWGACDAPSSPPQSVSDCFGVCSQLTGEDWQKCINACLEAIEE